VKLRQVSLRVMLRESEGYGVSGEAEIEKLLRGSA